MMFDMLARTEMGADASFKQLGFPHISAYVF